MTYNFALRTHIPLKTNTMEMSVHIKENHRNETTLDVRLKIPCQHFIKYFADFGRQWSDKRGICISSNARLIVY